MDNFNLDSSLSILKDFQYRTVNHVYNKLYKDKTSRKFLIADEVGLGKTMAARGIIAKIIADKKNNNERTDIIYICSNSQIAEQNINRLNILDQEFSHSSRITLLPLKIHDLKDNPINFISFTPGTSFNLKSSGGIKKERALIYHMLNHIWHFNDKKKYIRFFQCAAGDTWENYLLDKFKKSVKIDKTLFNNFIKKINQKIKSAKEAGKKDIIERIKETAAGFVKESPSAEFNSRRYQIIGELREILAISCVDSLKPELVILDEFQRFKDLIKPNNEKNHLFKKIFENKDVKTLLLSATPYKMYTLNQEDDDHYNDFVKTISVLFNKEDKSKLIKSLLNDYKNTLYALNNHNFDKKIKKIKRLKDKIEAELKNVMVRTERVKYTDNKDSMIKETPDLLNCNKNEIKHYLSLNKITNRMEVRNNIEYWKSAPYLISFMENNYKFKEKLNMMIEDDLLKGLEDDLKFLSLKNNDIENYKEIESANSRLKLLKDKIISNKRWRLIWMPPSMEYYRSIADYAKQYTEDYSKQLIFSSWKVVPRAVSSLLSYTAEREKVLNLNEDTTYSNERKTRSSLLNFNISEGNFKGLPIFNLIFPFSFFSEKINPLKISKNIYDGSYIPDKVEVLEEAENIIEDNLNRFLSSNDINISESSHVDQRWYWAAPLALDIYHFNNKNYLLNNFERIEKDNFYKKTTENFKAHFQEYKKTVENIYEIKFGKMPDDLINVLAKIALAAPGTVLKRAFKTKISNSDYLNAAVLEAAFEFRNFFNRPENISLIRDESSLIAYWEEVLDYSFEGNLQAVIDEYFHVLYESLSLQTADKEKSINDLKDALINSISLRTVSLNYDEYINKNGKGKIDSNRIRCSYSLKFSKAENYQEKEVIRESQVRDAFNSPFKPFVLTTTSIGQEGLDFHQYCHSIIHWNLPSNPVDLEQREGRINRYKSHVIRKNIAAKYKKWIFEDYKYQENDIWDAMFKKAEEDSANDLEPFWIFENNEGDENNYKIERHIPHYPLSREKLNIEKLRKSLAIYRMAFGQARQQDLVDFIREKLSKQNIDKLMKCRIDLSP